MAGLLRDTRFAVRQLRRNLGFTIAATVILAVAICANSTVFSGINGTMLHPIPGARNTDELVSVMRGEWSTSPTPPPFLSRLPRPERSESQPDGDVGTSLPSKSALAIWQHARFHATRFAGQMLVSGILLLTRLLLRKPFPRFAVPATKTSRPGPWFCRLVLSTGEAARQAKVGLRSLWRTDGADTRQTFEFQHAGRCLEPRLRFEEIHSWPCRLRELHRSCKKNWLFCRFSLCPSGYRLNEPAQRFRRWPPTRARAM